MTTAPGSASACSRAARFGVSPTTDCSCAEPSPDQIADHHQPGGDADTRLEIGGPHIEASDGIDDTQPSPDRALGVLLMGSRVTEINQHPVAYILGHKPVQLLTTPATAR
jgi:hypothetical protein